MNLSKTLQGLRHLLQANEICTTAPERHRDGLAKDQEYEGRLGARLGALVRTLAQSRTEERLEDAADRQPGPCTPKAV